MTYYSCVRPLSTLEYKRSVENEQLQRKMFSLGELEYSLTLTEIEEKAVDHTIRRAMLKQIQVDRKELAHYSPTMNMMATANDGSDVVGSILSLCVGVCLFYRFSTGRENCVRRLEIGVYFVI